MPEKSPAKPGKQPTDRKPKNGTAYEFTWKGSTYHLPNPETAVPRIPGRLLRDAYVDGEEGQMRLGFAMLENVEADPGAVDAIYDMPAPDMLARISEWMETRSSESGATLGESSPSRT